MESQNDLIAFEDDGDGQQHPSSHALGPNIDEDEALARRLMQEDVEQADTTTTTTTTTTTNPTATAATASDNDGVRSPIPQRHDVLVDPATDYYSTSYPYTASRGRGGSSRGIFNQRTPSIWNEVNPSESLADATGGSSNASEKANRLALMYRRPFEIMHHATLEEVPSHVFTPLTRPRPEMKSARKSR